MTRPLSRLVFGVVVAVLLLLLLVPAAAAAPKRITGKLNKGGYTVIAVAANGKAKAVRAARGGRFGVRPPATRVTLHLRAPNGRYGGPIVVGRKKKGKIAILGVRAGAKLGRIKVSVRAGYARVARKLRKKKWADTARRARARKAVPIGAGVFGRVSSRGVRTVVPGDQDLDGIPGPLDIDDDGDLLLDNLDGVSGPRAAQVLQNPTFVSDLTMDVAQTANANAPGATDAQIDAAFTNSGQGARLSIGIPPAASTELDCGGSANTTPPPPWVGGLVYCIRGGTGRTFGLGMPNVALPRFPECCDSDNDGFGTLVAPPSAGPGAMFLVHGATTAQFKTGDVVIERVNDANGVEIGAFTTTLQYVFATVPALVSYQDTSQPPNSVTLAYPYPAAANEFPVASGPGGDVVVTLTFWRPQRRPIPGEAGHGVPGAWTDIGGLNHTASVERGGGGCPQSAFSETDPNLTLPTSPIVGGGGFTDQAPDRPASAANTLTYTLNLTDCLTSPWAPGETRRFHFVTSPSSGGGVAQQIVEFKRQ